MRILQLAPLCETVPPPAYGGTETVVSALTEELVRRGHDVTLCASGDSSTAAELSSVFPRSLRAAGLLNDAMQYSLIHTAMAIAEAKHFDIIHNHNGPPSELGMALSHLTDVPMLTTLHNGLTDDTRFIWTNYAGWYNTISAQQALVTPRLPRARFAGVVHNGIDVDSFPFRVQKDGYYLFIGRICADKAPHLAIEAVWRAGGRIIIAGKIALTEEQQYFEEVLKPLVDGASVDFVGEADGLMKRQLYAGARALLVPLQWDEPFGLVMIEAMACGTPVVAFRRGAASEVVVDGSTGYLVEDVDEMAAAMQCVDRIDPRVCRQRVESNFGPVPLTDRYLKIYERIVGIKEPVYDSDSVPA